VKGFRDFLNQGNVVQLAVAVVIGGAFGAVVTALVADIINPIIAIPFGKPNFDKLILTINGSNVQYGTFLTAFIAFVFIATGVYFLLRHAVQPPAGAFALCRTGGIEHTGLPECLTVIPKDAHRCSACTAVVEPQAA